MWYQFRHRLHQQTQSHLSLPTTRYRHTISCNVWRLRVASRPEPTRKQSAKSVKRGCRGGKIRLYNKDKSLLNGWFQHQEGASWYIRKVYQSIRRDSRSIGSFHTTWCIQDTSWEGVSWYIRNFRSWWYLKFVSHYLMQPGHFLRLEGISHGLGQTSHHLFTHR